MKSADRLTPSQNNSCELHNLNLKLSQHNHTLVRYQTHLKSFGIVGSSWKDDDESDHNGVPFEQIHHTHGAHKPTAHGHL